VPVDAGVCPKQIAAGNARSSVINPLRNILGVFLQTQIYKIMFEAFINLAMQTYYNLFQGVVNELLMRIIMIKNGTQITLI
jgi:hypothetical protein